MSCIFLREEVTQAKHIWFGQLADIHETALTPAVRPVDLHSFHFVIPNSTWKSVCKDRGIVSSRLIKARAISPCEKTTADTAHAKSVEPVFSDAILVPKGQLMLRKGFKVRLKTDNLAGRPGCPVNLPFSHFRIGKLFLPGIIEGIDVQLLVDDMKCIPKAALQVDAADLGDEPETVAMPFAVAIVMEIPFTTTSLAEMVV